MSIKMVRSLKEYLSAVEIAEEAIKQKIDKNNEIAEEDKPTVRFFYRGQCNCSWNPVPSLFRAIDEVDEATKFLSAPTLYKEEQYLIQESKRWYPALFRECKSDVEKMTVAQHYEIPTRLLDVSENAFVALYFAANGTGDTRKEHEPDGKVFVFRTCAEQYRIASTLGGFDKMTIEGFQQRNDLMLNGKPVLVFPSMMTERQRAQGGAFFLFQNEVPSGTMIPFDKQDYEEILISGSCKKSIRDELAARYGISKEVLFPESLTYRKNRLVDDAKKRIRADFPQK